jgi:hypothetical protein
MNNNTPTSESRQVGHTPGPWRSGSLAGHDGTIHTIQKTGEHTGRVLVIARDTSEANAAFIVMAVNNQVALVEALA